MKLQTLSNIVWAFFFACIIWFSAYQDTTGTERVTLKITMDTPAEFDVRYADFPNLTANLEVEVELRGPRKQVDAVPDPVNATLKIVSTDMEGEEETKVIEKPLDVPTVPDEVTLHLVDSRYSRQARKLFRSWPPAVRVDLAKTASQEIHVATNISDETSDGYEVDYDGVRIEPSKVLVFGPKPAIDALLKKPGVEHQIVVVDKSWLPKASPDNVTRDIQLEKDSGLRCFTPVKVFIPIKSKHQDMANVEIPITFDLINPGEFPFKVHAVDLNANRVSVVRVDLEVPKIAIETFQPKKLHATVKLRTDQAPFSSPGFTAAKPGTVATPHTMPVTLDLPEGFRIKGQVPSIQIAIFENPQPRKNP